MRSELLLFRWFSLHPGLSAHRRYSEEKKQGLSLFRSPKFLGYYYSVLGPHEFKAHVYWKRIPLLLVRASLKGEIRPKGTIVWAASDKRIAYRIAGLESEGTIPDTFADYFRTIGTTGRMISMNIMTR